MRRMKVFLLIFALPLMAQAFSPTSERDCTDLDLRSPSLGNVRDQQDISWCYAFTGSDMLAHTYKSSERISAADVAIGYNETKLGLLIRWFDTTIANRNDEERKLSAHQTGLNKFSLQKTLREGSCPESVFPSEAWIKVTATSRKSVPLKQAMLEIAALHQEQSRLTASTLPYFYEFKNVDAKTFVRLIQTKNISTFYQSLREVVCQHDRQPFDIKWKVKMALRHSKVFQTVGQQMELNRLVGLDYDNRILKDSSHRGVSIAKLHTSSFVGRRWNQEHQGCEYLIRDSHGEGCDKYDPSYKCENGNVWLSEAQIYPNLISIVYMLSGQ